MPDLWTLLVGRNQHTPDDHARWERLAADSDWDEPEESGNSVVTVEAPAAHENSLEWRVAWALDFPAGPLTYYSLAASEVPAVKQQLAAIIRTVCSIDLRIEEPKLVWYTTRPTMGPSWRYDEAYGVAQPEASPQIIAILADRDAAGIVETTAHEVFHCRDRRLPLPAELDREQGLALAYGRKWKTYYEERGLRIHTHDGYPFNGETLIGVADYKDRLVARNSKGDRELYVNVGSRRSPKWSRFEP